MVKHGQRKPKDAVSGGLDDFIGFGEECHLSSRYPPWPLQVTRSLNA